MTQSTQENRPEKCHLALCSEYEALQCESCKTQPPHQQGWEGEVEIYKAMNSFLVKIDKPRSIERLDEDRHLFVERISQLLADQKQEFLNQKANQHDQEVRKQVFAEVVREIEGMLSELMRNPSEEDDMTMQALSDLKDKLKQLCQE